MSPATTLSWQRRTWIVVILLLVVGTPVIVVLTRPYFNRFLQTRPEQHPKDGHYRSVLDDLREAHEVVMCVRQQEVNNLVPGEWKGVMLRDVRMSREKLSSLAERGLLLLSLSGASATPELIDAISSTPTLESLALHDVRGSMDVYSHLQGNSTIKELTLVGDNVDDSVLDIVVTMSNVRTLLLGGPYSQEGLTEFRKRRPDVLVVPLRW